MDNEEFSAIIKKRNYQRSKIKHAIIEGEHHITVWHASFTKGIKFVFYVK